MRFTYLFTVVAFYLGITVYAAPVNDTHPPGCGSEIEPTKLASLEAEFSGFLAEFKDLEGRDLEGGLEDRALKVVNVWWHVIRIGNTRAQGYLSLYIINRQIARLNADFAPLGYSFRLRGLYYITSANWYTLGEVTGTKGIQMKSILRKGGVRDLNIYSVGSATAGGTSLAGYSSFPSDYSSNPKFDGIVIIVDAVYGSTAYSGYYTIGRTLVHEAGHWFGLYHPFQGGCSPPGDYVSDTPPEASPAYYCPINRDTCPGGGVDPIHNYMDYTSDVCRTKFTIGQILRARLQVYYYRGL